MPLQRLIARVIPVFVLAILAFDAHAQSPIPDPTGPYSVGRLSLNLTDNGREELFTEEPGDKRRLLVDVYYPASVDAAAERASYASPALMDVFSFDDEQRGWTAPVYADALAAEGRFPLLVFSPGLGNCQRRLKIDPLWV